MNKEIKKYISSVKRRLNLPKEIRTRLLSDLQTTIEARLEQGEGWGSIRESLGSPARVAAEYTEQMKEFAYRKSPWRFAFLGAAVILVVEMLDQLRKFLAPYVMSQGAGTAGFGEVDGVKVYMMFAPAKLGPVTFLVSIGGMLLAAVIFLLLYLRLRKCKQK